MVSQPITYHPIRSDAHLLVINLLTRCFPARTARSPYSTVSRVFWPLIAQYLQDYPPPPEDEAEGGGSNSRGSPAEPLEAGALSSAAPAAAGAPPPAAGNTGTSTEGATAAVEGTPPVGATSAGPNEPGTAIDPSASHADTTTDGAPAGNTAAGASGSDVRIGEDSESRGGAGRGGADDVGAFSAEAGDGYVCEACEAAAEAHNEGAGLGVAPMAVDGVGEDGR